MNRAVFAVTAAAISLTHGVSPEIAESTAAQRPEARPVTATNAIDLLAAQRAIKGIPGAEGWEPRGFAWQSSLSTSVSVAAAAAGWSRPIVLGSQGGGPVGAIDPRGILSAAWFERSRFDTARASSRGVLARTVLGRGGGLPVWTQSLGSGRSVVAWWTGRSTIQISVTSGRGVATEARSFPGSFPTTRSQSPLASLPGGRALVSWTRGAKVVAVIVGAAGTIGAPTEVAPAAPDDGTLPADSNLLATDANSAGSAAIMWTGQKNDQAATARLDAIVLRRRAADGTWQAPISVLPPNDRLAVDNGSTTMSMADGGDVAVSWLNYTRTSGGGDRTQPRMRWVHADGTLGAVVDLLPPKSGLEPTAKVTIAACAGTQALAVLSSSTGVRTRTIPAAGDAGPLRRASKLAAGDISVASNGKDVVAAWQRTAGSGANYSSSIYASRSKGCTLQRPALVGAGVNERTWAARPYATINARGDIGLLYDVGGNLALGVRAVFG